jgi:hypothetical protein
MFDLQDDSLTTKKRRESPIPHIEAGEVDKPIHPLDSPKAVELYGRLVDCYTRELDRQEENRAQQASDEDFYDNIQWSEEDAKELQDRGQIPLVYNVISTTVNWVIGTEKRGRTDYKVLPRRKDDAKPAERKTALLKYLADVNRSPFGRSRGFADAVKVGIGWLECGHDEGDDGEPLFDRYENWRNMLWDSACSELDLKDARYVIRSKWVDVDIAKALAPGRASLIEQCSRGSGDRYLLTGEYGDEPMDYSELELDRVSGTTYRNVNGYQRQRVRLVEIWFKVPEKGKRIVGGQFNGELFDPHSIGHQEEVAAGKAEVLQKPLMKVYVAVLTPGAGPNGGGLLHISPSPYRHNRFPFTPIWGNRRGRDGLPYGMIQGLRGMQEDINKRASKALHILSTSKTLVEEGAAEDLDELAEEISRPDCFGVLNAGGLARIETNIGQELAESHMRLMERSIVMIQQSSGVTDENLGRRTNATSGIAIERRQDQGSTATTHFFDNLRLAVQIHGEKQLANIEQFMSEPKQFRITNMRGAPEYVDVNNGLPENDIVRSKADFVIDEADWRASMRQAAVDQLLEAMTKMPPEAALVFLDLIVENMDIPNREAIVKRIRDFTGQMDPDAEEMTPEDKERMAAKQAQAQRQMEMENATLRKLLSEALKNEAAAEKTLADRVKANIASMGGPKRGAIDIAADTASAPALAPVADAILKDAGYVGRGEKEARAMQEAAKQADAAAQAQAQQQAQDQQRGAEQPDAAMPQQPTDGVDQ